MRLLLLSFCLLLSLCRPSPSSCRLSPCCPLPSSCRPSTCCPSPSSLCRLLSCCPLPLPCRPSSVIVRRPILSSHAVEQEDLPLANAQLQPPSLSSSSAAIVFASVVVSCRPLRHHRRRGGGTTGADMADGVTAEKSADGWRKAATKSLLPRSTSGKPSQQMGRVIIPIMVPPRQPGSSLTSESV